MRETTGEYHIKKPIQSGLLCFQENKTGKGLKTRNKQGLDSIQKTIVIDVIGDHGFHRGMSLNWQSGWFAASMHNSKSRVHRNLSLLLYCSQNLYCIIMYHFHKMRPKKNLLHTSALRRTSLVFFSCFSSFFFTVLCIHHYRTVFI